jgi:hypothetical protein
MLAAAALVRAAEPQVATYAPARAGAGQEPLPATEPQGLPSPPIVPPPPGSDVEAAALIREEQRAHLPLTFEYSTGFVSTNELGTGDRFGVGLDAALLGRTPWFLLGAVLGNNVFAPGQGLLYGVRASVRRPIFGPLHADLALDLGAQRFTTETVARDVTHLTDGTATLPFAAVRFGVAWNLDLFGSWVIVSAMARTTMGSESGTFAVRQCDGAQCVDQSQPYRFGGAMYGIVLAAGVDFDLLSAYPVPTPASRSTLPPKQLTGPGAMPTGSPTSPLPPANTAQLPAANPAILPGGNPAAIPAITPPYPPSSVAPQLPTATPTPAFPTTAPTPLPASDPGAPATR